MQFWTVRTEVKRLFLLHRRPLAGKQRFRWLPCLRRKMHGALFAQRCQILCDGSIEEWTLFPGRKEYLSNNANVGS